jgi:hypothetical protein
MKIHKAVAIVVVWVALTIASQSTAQHNQDRHQHHHYRLVDSGALGGPASYDWFGRAILNPHGTTVGWADPWALWVSPNGLSAGVLATGQTDPLYAGLPEVHAVLWEHAGITDLRTFPQGGYESDASDVNSRGRGVGEPSLCEGSAFSG